MLLSVVNMKTRDEFGAELPPAGKPIRKRKKDRSSKGERSFCGAGEGNRTPVFSLGS